MVNLASNNSFKCGVNNCGNGECVHKLTDEICPVCGNQLVLVKTTGFIFCSNSEDVCGYEKGSQKKMGVVKTKKIRRPLYDGNEPQGRRNITLSDRLAAKAKKIGGGNISAGIRKALEFFKD